jgi:hypothetical protein
MSLTLADTVMAAVHENGVNDFMAAFFRARPRHLVYGTPEFVPVTTVNATSISPMIVPTPFGSGTIDLLIVFAPPTLDFNPDSSGGTSPLPPGPGQLAVRTTVELTVACRPGVGRHEAEVEPLSASLNLFATGAPFDFGVGLYVTETIFNLDRLEIVDIAPDHLESVLECLMLMMLRAALRNFRLPFSAMSVGFFEFVLKNGPLIENDQIKVFGDVV